MKTTALLSLCLTASAAQAQDDFSKERWRFRGPTATVEEKLGRRSLYLKGTHAYLDGVSFAEGSIDLDLLVPRQRSFVGVLFRVASEGNHERVYLRPHKSGLDDALQYEANFDSASTWQLYSAPSYMRNADIPWDQWFHLRISVKGNQASVFLSGSDTPAMVVPDLKRGYVKGGIGLYAGAAGAWFSNLRYAAADGAPPPAPAPPAFAAGTVKSWEVSEAFDAEAGLPDALPASIARWDRVPVEAPGMLVIDRYRRSTGALPPSFNFEKRLDPAKGRRIVYARAAVESDKEQLKRLSIGYSDEVVVFLNGRPLYSGRSEFRFRDPTSMGILDVENDAVYLPLRKGRNELVLAVAEYFGGWGLAARFDDPSGLRLQ
jgi:hypothetical protein